MPNPKSKSTKTAAVKTAKPKSGSSTATKSKQPRSAVRTRKPNTEVIKFQAEVDKAMTIDNEISTLNQQLCVAENSIVHLYFELGQRLIERKSTIPHGEWGNYLKAARIDLNRAHRATRIFNHYHYSVEDKSITLTNLSLTEALEVIAQSKVTEQTNAIEPGLDPQQSTAPNFDSVSSASSLSQYTQYHPQENSDPDSAYTPTKDDLEIDPQSADQQAIARPKDLTPKPTPITKNIPSQVQVQYWQDPQYLAAVNSVECSFVANTSDQNGYPVETQVTGFIVAVLIDWTTQMVKAAIVTYDQGKQVQMPIKRITLIQQWEEAV
jgi:hypothetical protein